MSPTSPMRNCPRRTSASGTTAPCFISSSTKSRANAISHRRLDRCEWAVMRSSPRSLRTAPSAAVHCRYVALRRGRSPPNSAAFERVAAAREEHVTPSGVTQPFTYVVLRRTDYQSPSTCPPENRKSERNASPCHGKKSSRNIHRCESGQVRDHGPNGAGCRVYAQRQYPRGPRRLHEITEGSGDLHQGNDLK